MSALRNCEFFGEDSEPSADRLYELSNPVIRRKLRRLVRKGKIKPSECDDMSQEIYLRIFKRFKPQQPIGCTPLAMIAQIVNQSIAVQLRYRAAKKRCSTSVKYLSDIVRSDGREVDLSQAIPESQNGKRTGHISKDSIASADMGMDVADALRGLTDEQRILCDGLRVYSISELSDRLGQPRTTISSQVQQLRAPLGEFGLESYL